MPKTPTEELQSSFTAIAGNVGGESNVSISHQENVKPSQVNGVPLRKNLPQGASPIAAAPQVASPTAAAPEVPPPQTASPHMSSPANKRTESQMTTLMSKYGPEFGSLTREDLLLLQQNHVGLRSAEYSKIKDGYFYCQIF